jgi:membrane fusion protein
LVCGSTTLDKFDFWFFIMTLFRAEAINHRADRLSGDVAIAVPVAWQWISFVIFGGIIAGVIFLSLAEYARVETATGTIVPDAGVSAVMPMRSGVITRLSARDGQDVRAGAVLAAIRAEEDSASGLSTGAQIQVAIAQKDVSLTVQSRAAIEAAQAQVSQLAEQRAGLSAEIAELESQMQLQRALVESARKDLERVKGIAERGFVSGRDLQNREELLLSRQQGLAQLGQTLAARRASMAEAGRSAAQVAAQARVQSASLAATRAEVAQQAANASGSRSYVLRAPVAGRVTALTARVGQPVNPQSPLMSIVPTGSVLRAELAVPTAAIGFVKPGQHVRLAIDAFPYQRYGTVTGTVITVASSAVTRQAQNGNTIAIYPVTVALDRMNVMAFGRNEALLPGMSLSARIITEKQSLLEWLFEPLYAVRQR